MRRWAKMLGGVMALAAVSVQAQEPVVAFVDVSVIPMDREQLLAGQTVLVQGERITRIGPKGEVEVPAGALVVAGEGKFLLPGLADMHVHIFGDMQNKARTPSMLLALLAKGVTTVRDMHSGGRFLTRGHGSDSFALAVKSRVASGDLLGPRIYTAGDPARQSYARLRESIVALKEDGHDFVKVNDGWGSRAVYDTISAIADSIGLRVTGHLPHRPLGLYGVFEARWASIEHLMGYVNYLVGFDGGHEVVGAARSALADHDWLEPGVKPDDFMLREIVRSTRDAGVWNSPTLSVVRDIAYRANRRNAAKDSLVGVRYFDFDLYVVKALHDAGAGLLFGTDVLGVKGLLTDGYSLVQRELELFQQAGLTPYEVLKIATHNAARFMNADTAVGTVTLGKVADLVLLKSNPLEGLHHVTSPVGVMARGRWLPAAEIEQRLAALEAEHQRAMEQRRREREERRRQREAARGSSRTPSP